MKKITAVNERDLLSTAKGKRCKLCGSSCVQVTYYGAIRAGGLGKYTERSVPIFQCGDCGVIWHDPVMEDTDQYYESEEYRASMDEESTEEFFYRNHDKDTLDKLQYTGTAIFRNKTVADIGCGAGAFLDFLKGVAKKNCGNRTSKSVSKDFAPKGILNI